MQENLKVSAYCRVSTEKDEQLNSLESQRSYFADYINFHPGWELVKVYYDEGISGTQTRKRAGFNQMIEDAMCGGIDLILTKEVCRFARNTVDTLSYTRKLKEKGIGVIFTIDNIDTRDPDGELRLTIMASIAQEESRKTSERVKWGQKRRMEQGIVFGNDLLGYTVENGKLTICNEEVPIVRTIFRKYANEGKGTHTIARELIQEGMYPKNGNVWSNTALLRILRNEKYIGDLCQKKTYTPNYLTHLRKYNRGEEAFVYLENHHEPIIDRDLWNRTQMELQRRSPSTEQKSRHSSRYWCSGKLYCGICGKRFISRTKKRKDGSIYKAWRCCSAIRECSNGSDTPSGTTHFINSETAEHEAVSGCRNQSYNENVLLTCVQFCFDLLLSDCGTLKREILREIQSLPEITLDQDDACRIRKELSVLYEKKRKTTDLFLSEVLNEKEFREQCGWYDKKIVLLEGRLETGEREELIKKHQEDRTSQYVSILDEILDFHTEFPAGKSHSEYFYREILTKIILYPDHRLEVHLNCIPFGICMKIRTSGKKESYRTHVLYVSTGSEVGKRESTG
ncbi:MAG: recombinase family protein [Lachnospiraceae bacterium]|nr:recombinase family protein [Lachnospiraceae bacterium]